MKTAQEIVARRHAITEAARLEALMIDYAAQDRRIA